MTTPSYLGPVRALVRLVRCRRRHDWCGMARTYCWACADKPPREPHPSGVALGRVRALLSSWAAEIDWQQAQYGDGSDKVAIGRLIGRQDAYRDLLAALDGDV